jgi:signal transduction histidine kinase/CHASE1-domain containing sensor protein
MIPGRESIRYRRTIYACQISGLALLYYLTGRLGLLLAIPPGYATAVWPPSGIALAGLLLFGARVWPGVLVGSFALNVWTSLDPTDPSSTLRSLLIAMSIATGSTFQALLGERLVRGISGEPASKSWEGRRMAALALGGPIACVTAATVGVTTLALAKAITPANYPYSWMTWYVGDAIGVVIFTPIVLLWSVTQNRIPLRRRLAVSAPLAITFTLAVLLFTRVNALEQQQLRMEFERRSGLLTQTLQRGIDRTIEAFSAVGDLQDGLPRIDRSRFRALTLALLARHPELHSISWNVRVPQSRRARLESILRREGNVPGRITELDSQSKLVPSAVRREYFVVQYIQPYLENQKAVGYDVASSATGLQAMTRARETGEPTCTPPIRLIQEPENQAGCMVLLPIYWKRGHLATKKEGAEDFAGVMASFVRVGDLAESLLQGVHPPGIQIVITDPHGLGGSQRLYPTPARVPGDRDATSSGDQPAGHAGLHYAGALDVAEHRWRVDYAMTQEYLETHRPWQAWGVLVAGMAFTGLFGAYNLNLLGRSATVERLVALRTEELNRANEEAKSAQLQLIQAAKLESIGRLAAGVAHEVKNPLAVILFAIDYLTESLESPDPNVATALNDARKAVVRADGVIRALLDFSADTDLKPTLQDVNSVLQAALLLVHHALTKAHISVVEKLEGGLPPAMLDRNKIEQVLVNLIINAIDAMPNGGTLIARTRREWLKDLGPQAGVRKTDQLRVGMSAIVVEIEDTGTGIQETTRAKLFEPFFTTKPPGKGTGLGLAVCKSIVALHGGTIGIANKEGSDGARATVVLRSVRPKAEGNGDG